MAVACLALAVIVGFATPVAATVTQSGAGELREPTVDADEARDTARRILSEPPFAGEGAGQPGEEQFGQGGPGSGAPGTQRQPPPDLPLPQVFQGLGAIGEAVVWTVLVAVVVGAVWLVLRSVRGRVRKVAPDDDDGIVVVEESDEYADRSPDDWTTLAEQHEAAGRWREALRCRFRALVLELTERSVIDDPVGRTSGELRVVVQRASPDAAQGFTPFAELFDAVWYGHARAERESCERAVQLAEITLAAATAERDRTPGDSAGAGSTGTDRDALAVQR